ncbi:MAG: hypothetical protein M3Q09_11010 [Gemmatimonadota bacterium]|nr:hypothetical protein [Gemmatimonadota bacterium]
MGSYALIAPDSEQRGRFPSLAGLLLGLALCLHLAAVVQALLGKPAAGATSFLLGQCVVGFALLRLIDRAWVFQDIRFFFLLFYSLYGATLPLIFSLQGAAMTGLAPAAFLYGTGLVGFNLVQWWHKEPWRGVSEHAFDEVRPTSWNAVLLAGAFASVFGYAALMDVRFAFTIDRTQTALIGGQLWIVMMFVVNGMAMFMFAAWRRLAQGSRIVVMVSTIAFVMFHVSLGNRRDFLPMFIFLAALIATRRQAVIRLGTLLLGFVAFALLTLLGIVRQVIMDPRLLANRPTDLLLGNNEFITPVQTLMHYSTDNFPPLEWGWTYLTAPWLFIPRVFWRSKPESLSIKFLLDAFGSTQTIGFAYTPVTEAFINFSWVGPFIVLSILSVGSIWLIRNVNAHPGFYFIVFAMMLDFNRGEFSGSFYAVVCVSAGYVMMLVVSRLTWARVSPVPGTLVPAGAAGAPQRPVTGH